MPTNLDAPLTKPIVEKSPEPVSKRRSPVRRRSSPPDRTSPITKSPDPTRSRKSPKPANPPEYYDEYESEDSGICSIFWLNNWFRIILLN